MKDTLSENLYRRIFPGREYGSLAPASLESTSQLPDPAEPSINSLSPSALKVTEPSIDLKRCKESKDSNDDTSESPAEAATLVARTLGNPSTPEDSLTSPESTRSPSFLVRYEKELQWDTGGGLYKSMWTSALSGRYFDFDGPVSEVKRIIVQEGLGSCSYAARVDKEWMSTARDVRDLIRKQSRNERLKARWFQATDTSALSAFDLLVLATGIVATGGRPKGRTGAEEANLDAFLIAPLSEKNRAPNEQPIKAARLAQISFVRWNGRREGRRLMKCLVLMLQSVKSQQLDVDAKWLRIGDKLAKAHVMFNEGFCYWRKYIDADVSEVPEL